MKNIFLIFILFFMSNLMKSQSIDTTPGTNNKNFDIDKFVGTWVWKNGDESLEMVFRKANIIYFKEINVRGDVLYGFHKYMKNGKEIENSTQHKDMVLSSNHRDNSKTTMLSGVSHQDPNILRGTIKHLSKNKLVNFTIEYLDSNRIKLVKLENLHGIRVLKPGEKFDSSISLPQDIILTKQ